MSSRLQLHISNVIWQEAFDQYREDHGEDSLLWRDTKKVQEQYKADAYARILEALF